MKRILFYIGELMMIVAIAFVVAQMAGRSGGTASRRGTPGAAAVAVEVAPVRVLDMEDEGRFTGSLLPRARFVVAPKVAGRLKKLACDVGDSVSPGQVIAEIEDEEFVQDVAQAEADLAIARANLTESVAMLDIGRREFERVKAMRQQKVTSEAEVDAAQAQYKSREAKTEVNKAQVLQKEAALKTSRIRLSYTKIQAIWDEKTSTRLVGERFQDVGAMLSANTPILSLLDIEKVIAVVDVVERDYFRIRPGQEAVVTTGSLPGRQFKGTIVRMAPALDAETRQARVEIEIPNQDLLLKPGMFVTTGIRFARHPNVTAVPSSALVSRDGRKGVFRIDPEAQKAYLIDVEPGIVQGDFVEIASPSLDGTVVTMGQHLLEDGSPVLVAGGQTELPVAEAGKKGRKKP
ncbi:MAG TPA: efflux RND transporter periplasmic adaptor subunit [Candidatus Ozemobacteraceae bacterium]|nr:efflux RND transporter periplasmic adaptor subunit [Candidatus Ozemobacteraceae bacterium]